MFPLVLGGIGQKIIGGISFKEPSEKKAAKVVPQVVNSALGGNLLAIAVLDIRRTPGSFGQAGIVKERNVWNGGYNQVAASRPDLVQLYQQKKEALWNAARAVDFSSPESAAAGAVANVITKDTALPSASSTTPTGSSALLTPSGTPTNKTWLVVGLVVAAGVVVLVVRRLRKGR
jgi:hypothetical protein